MKPLFIVALLIAAATTPMVAQGTQSSSGAPEAGHRDPALNLAMGQWRFVAIGKTQVTTLGRQQPYLKFEGRDGTLTGFTGCNRLRGTYRASEKSLTLENVVLTRMACPGDGYEQRILETLNSVKEYRISRHELRLLGADGVLAVLIRPHEEQTMQPAQESK